MSSTPINITYLLGIPPDKLANIKAAAQTLRSDLLPYLRDLNADQRRALAKMGSGSIDFCDKTYVHISKNLQMKPGVVDYDAYTQTVTDYDVLNDIVNDLAPVFDQGEDSLMLLGSQKYTFSLACYNGFQLAAKLKTPGADLIVEDLAPRFAKSTSAMNAAKQAAKRMAAAAAKAQQPGEGA